MPKAIKESVVSPNVPEAITSNRWYILCPGCYEESKRRQPGNERGWILDAVHCFSTEVHQFNGDTEKPTLSPSLLMTYSYGEEKTRFCCHSFVKDGFIQFLGDCTHPLANQTVELLDCDLLTNNRPG
jgi:hypothetical protein